MDSREVSVQLPSTTTRNLSSSSSAFFSANQSPFFSPKSPNFFPLSTHSENPCQAGRTNADNSETDLANDDVVSEFFATRNDPRKLDHPSSSVTISRRVLLPYAEYSSHPKDGGSRHNNKGKSKKVGGLLESSSVPPSSFSPSSRPSSCDVYIGFHGHKPLLLRFMNWLRAELEVQGFNCFATDRARCRNSHKHSIVEKAIDSCAYGVVILTRKSFRNPYTIEELRFFSSKKNLVPVYFDLGPDDCLMRDIIERRGELWEKHGGELWLLYGGLEKEWRDAVSALSRVDDWKLEAHDGKWRDCILRGVTLLALRLGRRSVVDRLSKWRDKSEKHEFPFPRNNNFVGRKKELSELEFMLFGDVSSGDAERDYFEIKTRPKKRKNLTISWGRCSSMDEERTRQRDDTVVVWRESEKEIEMQNAEEFSPQPPCGGKKNRRRRKRCMKVVYGKGIACVSGESGIGKTELLLEFAYRFHQRYKMILWIGGESRYIRQNYMNLWSFLEIDVGVENNSTAGKGGRSKSFEEQEESAIARIRRELTRNIPFLIIIDNLEHEKDWWNHKHIMDLLPRFGGETHVIISTRLSRIMNLEPLRLSYLSAVEAISLMQGHNNMNLEQHSQRELDALHVIEEKLGRLTLGLAIVGAILSELPINPSRLLDTINRSHSRVATENHALRRNTFLLQLFEVCFSIFDHAADGGPRSLATKMVLASGWFGPAPVPVYLLSLAAQNIPEKRHRKQQLWRKIWSSLSSCGFVASSYARRSEAEAHSLLLRFNMARTCTEEGSIHFNHLVKIYARKRGIPGAAQAMVRSIISRGGSIIQASEHIWAACFLLLGFGKDPVVVDLKVQELLHLVKEVVLPLAIRTFITFSRCSASIELLRLSTEALEATDQEFVTPVDKWFDKSRCWGSIQTNAQLNPSLWQELALARASVLEVRAKLMARGGQLDVGDDLIRKAVFIRTSICGEDHPETVAAKETLSKLTRLIASAEDH